MTARSLRSVARPFSSLFGSFVFGPGLLLVSSALAACSSSTDPTYLADSQRAVGTPEAVEPPDAVETVEAVEVVEYGAGDTTVVFESGLGDDWTPWAGVATIVGRQARAFTYSRPGYGQSQPSTDPRDATHIVAELRTLLAARAAEPPYILVGHSLGGAYMELFAKAYPEEVAGVVLVDPRHRDFTAACEREGLAGCTVPAELVASLPEVQQQELEEFAYTAEAMAAAGSFGAYPVRVLTATSHPFTPEVEALWASLHGELAGEAADGEQIFAESGHYIQLEQVRAVAELIQSLLPPAGR
jgi:pimeloyl-ACP methyl ester carboxylesterase